jgi:hypothetical protein
VDSADGHPDALVNMRGGAIRLAVGVCAMAPWAVSLEDPSGRLRGRVLRWRSARFHPLGGRPTSRSLAELRVRFTLCSKVGSD